MGCAAVHVYIIQMCHVHGIHLSHAWHPAVSQMCGIQLCPTHAEGACGSEIRKWPSVGVDGVFALLCGFHQCDVRSGPTVPMPVVQALPTQQHSAWVLPPSPHVVWEQLR